MSHLCDSTVAGPAVRRDNVLATRCEYPPFRYPPEGLKNNKKNRNSKYCFCFSSDQARVIFPIKD